MTMLKAASCDNEYYLGDLPGTLQYSKDIEEILHAELPVDEETRGYSPCEHSLENLQRITPITQKNTKWKILLIMKSETSNVGEIWLKAALLNTETGKIALLSSTNNKDNIEKRQNRAIATVDGTWFVGHYRMCAPVVFWSELQNRLRY